MKTTFGSSLAFPIVILGLSLAGQANAQIFNWRGTTNNMATAANWLENTTPSSSPGTILRFSNTGGSNFSPLNTLGLLTIGSIEFSGNTPFNLQGSAFAAGGSTLTLSSTSSPFIFHTVSAPIQGAQPITKTGFGSIELSASSGSLNGAAIIQGGTMRLSNANALGSNAFQTINIWGGASLELNASGLPSKSITLSGTGTSGGGALVNLLASNRYDGNIQLGGASQINTAFGSTFTLGGMITNAQGLTFAGGGNFVLLADNTFSGGATIASGTSVTVGQGGTIGTGAIMINGDLVFNRAGTYQITNPVSGAGSLTVGGGGTIVFNSSNSFSGTTTIISGSTLSVDALGTLGNTSVTINGGSTLRFNRSSDSTVSNGLTGTGLVVQAGPARTTLSGTSSTFSGGVLIQQGTLRLSNANALGSNASQSINVSSGAALELNATGLPAKSIILSGFGAFNGGALINLLPLNAYNGNIELGGAAQITTASGSTFTLGGVIANPQSLTFAGGGSFILGADNTFSGGSTIAQGTSVTVGLGGPTGTIGTGAITIDGDLFFNRTGTYQITNSVSGAGSLTIGGGGTVEYTTPNSFIGATIINAANTLRLSGGGTLGLAAGSVVNNGSLIFDRGGIYDASQQISGTGAVSKFNSGTIALSANNSYSGPTTIANGILIAENASALGSTDAGTTVQGGATLRVNNTALNAETIGISGAGAGNEGALQGVGTSSLSGLVELNDAATIGTDEASTLTFDVATGNAIDTSGFDLNFTGPGVIVISDPVVGDSTVHLTSGTLRVNSSFNVNTMTVSAGSTLSGSGTINANTTTVSGVLAPGDSPGDLNFDGDLILSGTTQLEITGSGIGQFDRLIGAGGLLTLGGILELNNTGYVPSLGDSLEVFNNWNITGSFSTFIGTDLGGGLSWDASALGTTGVLTVVPEPSLISLVGLGILCALGLRCAPRRS